MAVTVHTTAYGAPAYRVLAEVVRAAKQQDPLAPVTLVVPSERVGVAARRALARGVHPDRPGIAALHVVTLRRLAETLAAAPLIRAGRRPLTGPVLIGAVRATLADAPGVFAPVAEHIGTVRAVAAAHRALRPLDEATLDRLAEQGEVVADTVRLHRVLRIRLAARSFDEVDLLRAVTTAPAGAVVAFLPQDLEVPEAAFLATVGQATDLHVVVGLTGDARADHGPMEGCRALGVEPKAGIAPPLGDTVLHASDPDDEVRGVVRRVVAALATTPGHRVAVLYGTADPYARLLHEHLGRAGITLFGRGVRSTAESRFGRGILRLLSLPDHDFRRDEVLAFVADAPVRHNGAAAPSSAWERVSRAAGVVRGDDWSRLTSFAEEREAWADDHPDPDDRWRAERARRQAQHARDLHAFVTGLRAALKDMAGRSTRWHDLAEAALRLWTTTLGGDDLDGLPPEEQRAAQRITLTLRSLSGLDDIAGPADAVLLREVVELELADDLDRVGRIGEGVHVGPVSEGVGEDVDQVFVVGAAEGMLPPRAADDPLLPDHARASTGGALPTLAERVARQHRHLLAALAAAPDGGRVLSLPRGDLRAGGTRVLSRWLLPTVRALAGFDVPATDWDTVDALVELPSYAGSLLREARPATEQEWRQRAAVDATDAPQDPVLDRAREVRAARRSTEFTPYDGNLAGERLPDPTAGGTLSATALEAWVHCPHGYFVRHLLRVSPVEQPEEVVRISALDKGNVVHEILERLVVRAVEDGWAPGPGEPWPSQAREVLMAAADERFARAQAEGVTGFALLWQQDREAIRADLLEWLAQDDQRRRELGGLVPAAAEWAFDDAEIPLGDGRVLRLRGKIDRIDRAPDGGLVVTDYKTGKADSYQALQADPLHRGQRLQLPLYAAAARPVFGSEHAAVRSEYWFTSRRGRFARIGYLVDAGVLERTRIALRTVVDGISRGVFLARPNDKGNVLWECPGCDPDGRGEYGVDEAWQRKGDAPELAALRALLDGD